MIHIDAQVTASLEVMPQIWQLYLEAPKMAQAAHPGQFLMVKHGTSYDPYLRTMLPFCRIGDDTVSVLLNGRSDRENSLHRHVGECLDVWGPLGHGFQISSGARNLLLIGEGLGRGTLLSLINWSKVADRDMTLVSLVSEADQGFPSALLPAAAEYHRISAGASLLEAWKAFDTMMAWADHIYIEGSNRLQRELYDRIMSDPIRRRAGLAQAWVSRPMACGLGICKACAVHTRRGVKQACHDGPVFDLYSLF